MRIRSRDFQDRLTAKLPSSLLLLQLSLLTFLCQLILVSLADGAVEVLKEHDSHKRPKQRAEDQCPTAMQQIPFSTFTSSQERDNKRNEEVGPERAVSQHSSDRIKQGHSEPDLKIDFREGRARGDHNHDDDHEDEGAEEGLEEGLDQVTGVHGCVQKPLSTLKAKPPPAITPRNSQAKQSAPMSGSIFFSPFIRCANVTAGFNVGIQYLPLHNRHPKQNPPDSSESIYEKEMLLLKPPQTVNPQVRRSDPVVQKMRMLAMMKWPVMRRVRRWIRGKVPLSRRHNLITVRLSMSSTQELLCCGRQLLGNGRNEANRWKVRERWQKDRDSDVGKNNRCNCLQDGPIFALTFPQTSLPFFSIPSHLSKLAEIKYHFILEPTSLIQQYYQKMENDSCEQTQPCLPNNIDSFPTAPLQSQQIFQCPRFTITSNKPKNSRVKRNKTVELQGKPEDVTHKIDEKIRLAARGVRQPILGELPCQKILEEYREGSARTKKKSFFLCC